MSLLDRFQVIRPPDLSRYRRFVVDGHTVGFVAAPLAARLREHGDVFVVADETVGLSPELRSYPERTAAVDGVICSNSLCWSPDSRTMYYADSYEHAIWAFDFDPGSGDVRNRRVFVEIPAADGVPDGATVDAEGGVWVAHWNGWRVTRYDPKGRIERFVKLPVQKPTCPMFGGADLDVIYVTSASIHLTPEDLKHQPEAGGIFAFEPGVRGLPEAHFKG